MKYIFLENEDFIQYADFTNSVVYLLNKTKDNVEYPDKLIINEISEDLINTSAMKLPAMMSYANEHYLENCSVTTTVINKETNEEQEQTEFTEPFEYEVYTDNKDKYYIQVCVCDEASIKTIADNKVETENTEPQAEQPQVLATNNVNKENKYPNFNITEDDFKNKETYGIIKFDDSLQDKNIIYPDEL